MRWSSLPAFFWQRRSLSRRKTWPADRLRAFQERRLAELRAFALARSPFYRRFHRGLEEAPLSRLPVLTKADLMENFDDLVTDRAVRLADAKAHMTGPAATALFRGRYVITATSGTTGQPGIILHDPGEWRAVIGSYGRPFDWAGLRFRPIPRIRMAMISTRTPWHQSARVGESLRNPLIPTLRLDANDPPEFLREQLRAFRPEVLIAYPSVLRLLAEEERAGRPCVRPGSIFPIAEVLSDEARGLIRRTWGCDPCNVYGATESAGIASECRRRSLHIYDDMVLLENVDGENRPVPAGEWGERILVTVLGSRTLPLVRYAIGDRIRISERACGCGLPFRVIEGIQGREQEIIRLPGEHGNVALHPVFFRSLLEPLPVKGWQVRQDTASSLRILVAAETRDAVPADLADAVRRGLLARGAADPRVVVEWAPAIEKGATGKTAYVKALAGPGAE